MRRAARKSAQQQSNWPRAENSHGVIDLHFLPPIEAINGARIRELTGDDTVPANAVVMLQTFRAVVGTRESKVGFCIGDGERFSAIGIAVIDRLTREAPDAPLHVVPIVHEDIAWDLVLRHLRTFAGKLLLFAFPDSDVYDAGTAEMFYSEHVRTFDLNGNECRRLTAAQRRAIRAKKAAILDRPPPPPLYVANIVAQEEVPWIFRFVTPVGKVLRVGVWDGRRDYAHEFSPEITRWVGGDKIALVQVDSPVGINRRSSLTLTHRLSKDFDGIIHWARDTKTYQSILRSFVRLDLESVAPPDLPDDWKPDIVIFGTNS